MDAGASPSRVTSSRVIPEAKVIGVATQRKRAPYLNFLPDVVRNHFIAMCGEFTGTFLFLFFAFSGTQVANSQTQGSVSTTIAQGSNPAQLLYISLCFGFSLAVTAWVFFRISGGLFNPAVRFLDDALSRLLLITIGYPRDGFDRINASHPRRSYLHFSNTWCNLLSRYRLGIVPWTTECADFTRSWNFHCARSIH